jgi:hypothetical protein
MRTAFIRLLRTALFTLTASFCIFMLSCKSSPNQAPTSQTKTAQPAEAPLPPPTLDDVRAKIDSIYRGALTIDQRRAPTFLLGDFNADNSPDVLVAVRPNPARLADLNSDLAAWILEDPRLIWVPDPNKIVQVMPPVRHRPVRVRARDRLWLIIHGFRGKGWRNPIATQSYLLVNVAANGLRKQSAHEATAELNRKPFPLGIQYLLRYNGDVLQETVAGKSYLLYWTGGHYARTEIQRTKAAREKIAVNKDRPRLAM